MRATALRPRDARGERPGGRNGCSGPRTRSEYSTFDAAEPKERMQGRGLQGRARRFEAQPRKRREIIRALLESLDPQSYRSGAAALRGVVRTGTASMSGMRAWRDAKPPEELGSVGNVIRDTQRLLRLQEESPSLNSGPLGRADQQYARWSENQRAKLRASARYNRGPSSPSPQSSVHRRSTARGASSSLGSLSRSQSSGKAMTAPRRRLSALDGTVGEEDFGALVRRSKLESDRLNATMSMRRGRSGVRMGAAPPSLSPGATASPAWQRGADSAPPSMEGASAEPEQEGVWDAGREEAGEQERDEKNAEDEGEVKEEEEAAVLPLRVQDPLGRPEGLSTLPERLLWQDWRGAEPAEELDLVGWQPTDGDLRRIAASCGPTLLVLRIHISPWVTDAGVTALSACTGLRVLSLAGCARVGDRAARFLCSRLPHLRVLDLSGCPHVGDGAVAASAYSASLETLLVSGCLAVTDEALHAVADSALQRRQRSEAALAVEEGVRVRAAAANAARQLPLPESDAGVDPVTGLRTARVAGAAAEENAPGAAMASPYAAAEEQARAKAVIGSADSGLRRLDLAGCRGITAAGVSALLRHVPSLTELDLSGCPAATASALAALPASRERLRGAIQALAPRPGAPLLLHGPSSAGSGAGQGPEYAPLRSLTLGAAEGVDDEALGCVARGCPALQRLVVASNDSVTDAGMAVIAERCPRLEVLRVPGCPRLTSGAVAALLAPRDLASGAVPMRELDVTGCSGVGASALLHVRGAETVRCAGIPGVTDAHLRALARGCGDSLRHIELGRHAGAAYALCEALAEEAEAASRERGGALLGPLPSGIGGGTEAAGHIQEHARSAVWRALELLAAAPSAWQRPRTMPAGVGRYPPAAATGVPPWVSPPYEATAPRSEGGWLRAPAAPAGGTEWGSLHWTALVSDRDAGPAGWRVLEGARRARHERERPRMRLPRTGAPSPSDHVQSPSARMFRPGGMPDSAAPALKSPASESAVDPSALGAAAMALSAGRTVDEALRAHGRRGPGCVAVALDAWADSAAEVWGHVPASIAGTHMAQGQEQGGDSGARPALGDQASWAVRGAPPLVWQLALASMLRLYPFPLARTGEGEMEESARAEPAEVGAASVALDALWSRPSVERALARHCAGAVGDEGVAPLAESCTSLQTVSLAGCARVGDRAAAALAVGVCADSLLALDLSWTGVTSDGAAALLAACPALHSLDLSGCPRVDDGLGTQCAAACAATGATLPLERLLLAGCTRVGDEGVTALAPCCPALRAVSLAGCLRLTGAALRCLAAHCPDLHALDASGLPSVAVADLAGAVRRLRRLAFLHAADVGAPLSMAAALVPSRSAGAGASLRYALRVHHALAADRGLPPSVGLARTFIGLAPSEEWRAWGARCAWEAYLAGTAAPAATRIQALARGMHGRDRAARRRLLRRAFLAIREVRSRAAARAEAAAQRAREEVAVVLVQRVARGLLARAERRRRIAAREYVASMCTRPVQDALLEVEGEIQLRLGPVLRERSGRLIQRIWRGWRARQYVSARRRRLREACRKLHAAAQTALTRRALAWHLRTTRSHRLRALRCRQHAMRVSEYALHVARWRLRSVTVLQSLARRRLAMRRAAALRERRELARSLEAEIRLAYQAEVTRRLLRDGAALRLQHWYRVRKPHYDIWKAHRSQAATTIQRFVRKLWARQLDKAACSLQRWWRHTLEGRGRIVSDPLAQRWGVGRADKERAAMWRRQPRVLRALRQTVCLPCPLFPLSLSLTSPPPPCSLGGWQAHQTNTRVKKARQRGSVIAEKTRAHAAPFLNMARRANRVREEQQTRMADLVEHAAPSRHALRRHALRARGKDAEAEVR